MKIFIDGTVLQQPATGISKSLLEIYGNCAKLMPLEVTILHKDPLCCDVPEGIKSTQIGSNFPDKLWRSVVLPLYVWKNKPDFLHLPWNNNVPHLFNGTKVILTIYDVLPLEIPNYFKSPAEEKKYRKNMQKSIDRSDIIFTISKYSKMKILENFSVDVNPEVIYLASTLENHFLKSTKEFNFEYFLYVGGYDQRKGIELLLKNFIKLHNEKKLKSKLILTGSKHYFSTSFKDLLDEGTNLGIVIEKGYVSESDLFQLYSNSVALVYPSKYEGFGLPPLEAMSAGCPVITTKKTSIPEVCGDAVYYVDVDNELDFSKGLIALENDCILRNELIKKGQIQASRFNWSFSAKKFLKKLVEIK